MLECDFPIIIKNQKFNQWVIYRNIILTIEDDSDIFYSADNIICFKDDYPLTSKFGFNRIFDVYSTVGISYNNFIMTHDGLPNTKIVSVWVPEINDFDYFFIYEKSVHHWKEYAL